MLIVVDYSSFIEEYDTYSPPWLVNRNSCVSTQSLSFMQGTAWIIKHSPTEEVGPTWRLINRHGICISELRLLRHKHERVDCHELLSFSGLEWCKAVRWLDISRHRIMDPETKCWRCNLPLSGGDKIWVSLPTKVFRCPRCACKPCLEHLYGFGL